MSGAPSGTTPSFLSLRGLAESFREFSFIAGDTANSLPPFRGAYQLYCQVWAGSGVPSALAQSDPVSFCAPYLAEDNRTFGQEGVEFTGGQCDTLYGVLLDFDRGDQVFPGVFTFNVQGPVNGVESEAGSSSGSRWFIRHSDGMGGTKKTTIQNNTPDGQSYSIQSVSRNDGQPDDCGDPPGEFQPGDNYGGEDYDQPETYVDDQGRDYSISVGVPTVNEDGTISLPVTIDGDTFDVGVPGASAGDGSQDFGESEVGPEVDPGEEDGEILFPPAPPGTVCIGVAISIGGFPTDVGFVSGTAPNRRAYEVIGNVSLVLEANDTTRFYGEDFLIRSERTFIPIPVEGLTCAGFRLQLDVGSVQSARPVYRLDDTGVSDGS